MNAEEALALVEAAVDQRCLNPLQRTVFCAAWNACSYQEVARQSGYELSYIKQTGSQLWQLLSQAFDEKITKHNVRTVLHRKANGLQQRSAALVAAEAAASAAWSESPHCDWGDAISLPAFYGRETELQQLQQWLLDDGCRLVVLFGMGGIGKTSLAVKLAQDTAADFQVVVWRSLRNAPPLADLLTDLIQVISSASSAATPPPDLNRPCSLEQRLSQLLQYLRQRRCLIILDNGETVLQEAACDLQNPPTPAGYAWLWQRLGEAQHQSTILLTSREKPSCLATREGKGLPIRSLRLTGLPLAAGQALLDVIGEFSATPADWRSLIHHYAGNPLALKMVAPVIRDVFDGQVAGFLDCLQEGTSVFADIQDLLMQQIGRRSPLEHQILHWLAIARKPLSLSQLRANLTPPTALSQLLEALSTLERCCLIEKTTAPGQTQPGFTLQPVVMEYLSEQLIQQVSQELMQPPTTAARLCSHALMQAHAKDYLRETQQRLLLQPIADRLRRSCGLNQLIESIQEWLRFLRSLPQQGYAVGNLINLLHQLGVDLQGWDFSGLTIRSAYLRGMTLHRVNFDRCNFSQSVFTETFSQILALAFSPDGTLLATGDVNHEIHLWRVADGTPLLSLRVNEGWIWSVAFSPDGRLLASSANRAVHLWDGQTGECLHTLRGYSDRVFSVAFSADGQLLATGSEDHLVRIWQVRTGKLLHTLSGHSDEVRAVAFNPCSAVLPESAALHRSQPPCLLASASYDGTVRLWNAVTGRCVRVLTGHSDWVWSVAFSPDGRLLASGSSDATVKLWDVKTGRCGQTLLGHWQPIRAVAFSPNGRTLASGSGDRTVRLWDYRTGNTLRVLTGHSSWISSLAFSPDTGVLASGSEDQSVRLWDSQTHRCLKTLQGYSNGIWSVAFSPDGTRIASGSQDRLVRLWHAQTGEPLGSLSGHTSWVWSVAFSPSEDLLASSSEDRTIRLWHWPTRRWLCTLDGHDDAVLAVSFSPVCGATSAAGQTLFSASLDGTIRVWDVVSGHCRQVWREHSGGVWCLALSRDGQYLVSGSQDQTLKLWDTASGRCLRTFLGHESWIRCVAFADPQTLLSGSADGHLKRWCLHSGDCLQSWAAHQGPVLSVAVQPESGFWVSSGTDRTIRLWDAATGQCRQVLDAHQRWVRCLTYSPDGRILASASQDETLRLWQLGQSSDPWLTPNSATPLLRVPRPYEGMTLNQATGLTPAQKASLLGLGASEQPSRSAALPLTPRWSAPMLPLGLAPSAGQSGN